MQAVEESMREEAKQQEQEQQPIVLRAPARKVAGNSGDEVGDDTRKGFLPQLMADSMRSEDDYFLPFDDEDNAIPEEEAVVTTRLVQEDSPPPPPPPLQPEAKPQEPRSGRDVAVAALGEFFLCESPAEQRIQQGHVPLHASPVSTIEIDRALSSDQQLYQKGSSKSMPMLTTDSLESDSFQGNDSLASVLEDEPEDGGGATADVVVHEGTSESDEASPGPRRFVKLSHSNRTTSLPLDLTPPVASAYQSVTSGTPTRLTRRSSLKKISSYGMFPPSKSSNSLKRNVSFGNMQIREYNVALSDHPSCSYGPPIQLSWEYQEKAVVPLESYEASREGNRRQGHSLLLSFYERHFMLIKQAGYSKREIKETMREVERVKRERQVTDLFLAASPIDETMEHVMDTVKQFFRRGQGNEEGSKLRAQRKEAVI